MYSSEGARENLEQVLPSLGKLSLLCFMSFSLGAGSPTKGCATVHQILDFEIISKIGDIEIIAVGRAVRDVSRLNKVHGAGRWRMLKGSASVRLPSGRVRFAEVHWYEAHGIEKRDFKIKRYLD